MNMQDVIVSLLSMLDVMSGAVLALSFGYKLVPAAFGFLVGGVGSLLTGSVTPVSFQQEGLVLSRDLGDNLPDRVSMILLSGFITGLLGIMGLPQYIVNTVGLEIFYGLLAGVGIYLTKVGFDLAKEELIIGLPCIITALLVQLWTDNLVYTIAISVPLGIIIKIVKMKLNNENEPTFEQIENHAGKNWWERLKSEIAPVKLRMDTKVLIGGLALSTLTIGANIAYTGANLSMADMEGTYNQVTIISGVADFATSLFGGPAMEVIVSATAAAPHPIASGALMMFGAAFVLLTGIAYKLAKYVPISAMGGYLICIGAILVLPYNAIDAFNSGNPIVVALTMGTTAATNPFYGLVVGVLAKLVMGWFGVL